MKELLSGIRKFCVYLFWPRKSDKNRYDDLNQQKSNVIFEAKDERNPPHAAGELREGIGEASGLLLLEQAAQEVAEEGLQPGGEMEVTAGCILALRQNRGNPSED